MNIGDRVRVLHGQEEGIVTKIVDSKTVEIEIEDGFSIPVLIAELVTITSQEGRFFSSDSSQLKNDDKKEVRSEAGIFLSLHLSENSDQYVIDLINNTDNEVLCAILKKEGKLKYAGIFRGHIEKRNYTKVTEFNQLSLSNFSELYCQIILYDKNVGLLKPPIERQIRITRLLANSEPKAAPVTGKLAWTIQIDDIGGDKNIEKPDSIKETEDIPTSEVDLHAEALGIEDTNMSSREILEQQLLVFNKALDNAIVHGLKEVTFIHGVGQGTLKNRILEEVRSRKEIKYWQDAQKSKFGYGATKIVL
jgi:hypothetical protein